MNYSHIFNELKKKAENYIMYFSIYMKFKNRPNSSLVIYQNSGYPWCRQLLTGKEFGDLRESYGECDMLCVLKWGGSSMNVFTNSSRCTIKIRIFCVFSTSVLNWIDRQDDTYFSE